MDNLYSTGVVIIILLALSAFFSATETALTGANRVRLKTQAEAGDGKAKKAIVLINNYNSTLSTLLIGNNIVNTSMTALATAFSISLFNGSEAAVAGSTALITVLIIIFGEVIPKGYASMQSETVSKFSAFPLSLCKTLLFPVVIILEQIKKVLLPSNTNTNPSVTEDELKVIIEEIEDEGVIEEDQSELLQSALEFSDISVDEILTPRVDIYAVPDTATQDEIVALFIEQRFSRLPVYKGNFDNIIGVLNQKDYFSRILMGEKPDISSGMQKCLYVPPKRKINDLMADLQRQKLHMAIVTDEHGGTLGIVTLEDILEELVGEIWDEHDEITYMILPISPDKYEISGEILIEDLFETIDEDLKYDDTPSATVAGLALELLGRIPESGETFEFSGYEFEITKVDDQRIVKLTVEKINKPQD